MVPKLLREKGRDGVGRRVLSGAPPLKKEARHETRCTACAPHAQCGVPHGYKGTGHTPPISTSSWSARRIGVIGSGVGLFFFMFSLPWLAVQASYRLRLG